IRGQVVSYHNKNTLATIDQKYGYPFILCKQRERRQKALRHIETFRQYVELSSKNKKA
ncbi:unnamed protein product, partial [Rotaria magnacalcarata]